ncbi:hypothetical protein [Nitrosomonas sp. Nm34]|nr:hypothetical protein [Nitrosomonas sp. Nm34]SFJ05511.1 hypothetical protein SAMN05428978_10911 [Nitrosomonas sp. Nm34]
MLWIVQAFELPFKTLPDIHADYLLELVLAMLGLSGVRMVEKIKGVAK